MKTVTKFMASLLVCALCVPSMYGCRPCFGVELRRGHRCYDQHAHNGKHHLRILQSDSAKITSFFHAPLTKYAAL